MAHCMLAASDPPPLCSPIQVYDGSSAWWTEAGPTKPVNAYGRSKLEAEGMLQQLWAGRYIRYHVRGRQFGTPAGAAYLPAKRRSLQKVAAVWCIVLDVLLMCGLPDGGNPKTQQCVLHSGWPGSCTGPLLALVVVLSLAGLLLQCTHACCAALSLCAGFPPQICCLTVELDRGACAADGSSGPLPVRAICAASAVQGGGVGPVCG